MGYRVLITGGSGLLAVNWALAIHDRYQVMLVLHRRRISLSGVETDVFSLDSLDAITTAFKKHRPDIVVHTVGLTSVERCADDPTLAQQVNVNMAVNVATVCAELNIKLVHISTDHLFSGENKLVNETDPIAPLNSYAQTKAEAEKSVQEVYPQALIVRTNFYGWGPSYRKSFSDMIIDELRNLNSITLYQDVFFTPILIETLVNAVHELIDKKSSGVFHIVGDERISKYQFGLKLAQIFNLDQRLIQMGNITDRPDLVHRPKDMSLSNEKVCRALNRKLGNVDEQLRKLLQQEENGYSRQVKQL